MLFVGIDLGTSAVKLLLVDEAGKILNTVSREYPLDFPHPGWSEQNPEDWMRAVMDGMQALTEGFDKSQIAGIGSGGQQAACIYCRGRGPSGSEPLLRRDRRLRHLRDGQILQTCSD